MSSNGFDRGPGGFCVVCKWWHQSQEAAETDLHSDRPVGECRVCGPSKKKERPRWAVTRSMDWCGRFKLVEELCGLDEETLLLRLRSTLSVGALGVRREG